MAVHLTRIYTRAGDKGGTRLGNNEPVAKTHPRIAAYADVDECNAALGAALALGGLADDIRAVLSAVQNDLFDVGADLSNPVAPDPPYPPLRITGEYVERLEAWCDDFNARVPDLDSFVLPGGTPGAALLHVARTVARRAERSAWALHEADPDRTATLPITYLNRLSDLLFILSRVANPTGDVLWVPGATRRPTTPTPPTPAGGAGPVSLRRGEGASPDAG
jgi:cob(I)alamin adenosyltransferase